MDSWRLSFNWTRLSPSLVSTQRAGVAKQLALQSQTLLIAGVNRGKTIILVTPDGRSFVKDTPLAYPEVRFSPLDALAFYTRHVALPTPDQPARVGGIRIWDT